MTAFSDVVDENDGFRDGGYLTQLGPVLGIGVEDFGALVAPDAPASDPGERIVSVVTAAGPLTGTLLAEEIRVTDAAVLGSFSGGRSDGRPAFTVRAHASGGYAWYLATVTDAAGAATVLDEVFAAAGVEPLLPGVPETVEVARRGDVLTLINHGRSTVRVDASGTDLLSGVAVDEVVLEPFGYVLLGTAAAGSSTPALAAAPGAASVAGEV